MRKVNKTRKVFVGLSGGVDSSVAAYLLLEAGYDVIGVFIRTWQPEWLPCTWRDERRDAMRVAAHLRIPFVTMDLQKEYKKEVADYMISEYKAGRTPNPDVMCNKEIKFGAFLSKALRMGADYVATGHYARLRQHSASSLELLASKDKDKEQSYFLWTLTQKQLGQILFPIGHLRKGEVREIARKAGLHTATKKDSQGICFLGKVKMRDFLGHYAKKKKGAVLNANGEAIGFHFGAVFYTIGERHGFTITKKTTSDEPYYVLNKDVKKNTLVVGTLDELNRGKENSRTTFQIIKVNWINTDPARNKHYSAQVRYHQKYQKCHVQITENKTSVIFDRPQTVAPGQSIVIYDKDVCLGGGIVR